MSGLASNHVAEIPGIYGPVSISERIIQRIWAQQDFIQRDLRTLCGKTILIQHPGRWNRSEEGPDFRDAVWEMAGERVIGDVEIHFYAQDWKRHGHDSDPNFARVRLHVILFEPPYEISSDMPTVVLGPYLKEDLESYLISQGAEGDLAHFFEDWSDQSSVDIRKSLIQGAGVRWRQKLAFAQRRLESLGFAEAMHSLTLEVLGYRRNRAVMADVAHAYPTSVWVHSPPSPEKIIGASSRPWIRSGMRPANLPDRRLGQYRSLWLEAPDWIEQVRSLEWPKIGIETIPEIGAFRKQVNMPKVRQSLLGIVKGSIGGTRFDTLLIDAWLPLLAAHRSLDLEAIWHAWYAGDFPGSFTRALSLHGVTDGRSNPHANAWNQGLLQHIFTG